MRGGLRLIAHVVSLVAITSGCAVAAQKDEPSKMKYENIPVEASCLEGYHPTVDPYWGNVFPCIKNAEIVAPPKNTTPAKAPPAATLAK